MKTALLTSMRERREGGQRMRTGGRERGQGQGQQGAQRQRRALRADGAAKPGGQAPKRPDVE